MARVVQAAGCPRIIHRASARRPVRRLPAHGEAARSGDETRRRAARQSCCRCRASSRGGSGNYGDNDDAPHVMGDWRSFRAKLVSESSEEQQTSKEATDNFQVLRQQNPSLAAEGLWCHASEVETGGLIIAQPQTPDILGDQRYWQVVILLVQHNSQGSVGLILNRPSGIKLGALPVSESGPSPLQISFRDNSLYLGGFDANQIPTGSGGHCRKFHPWRWRGTYAQLRPRFRTVSDDLMLAEPEPQGKNPFTDSKLHCGGYFHQQVVHLMHGRKSLQGSVEVVPGIYLGGESAAAEAVNAELAAAHEFRFFAGCKIWEPGQLAREMAAGAWASAACSRSLVLKQCLGLPTPLWKEVMELMGGEFGVTARAAYGEI